MCAFARDLPPQKEKEKEEAALKKKEDAEEKAKQKQAKEAVFVLYLKENLFPPK